MADKHKVVVMPRKRRFDYADAMNHGMSRGDRREDIFPELVCKANHAMG